MIEAIMKEFANRESDLGRLATNESKMPDVNDTVDYDSSLADDNGDLICSDTELDKPWYNLPPGDFVDAGMAEKYFDDLLDVETLEKQTDDIPVESTENKDSQTATINETGENNCDAEEIGKAGGRYQDLKNEGWGWNTEPPTEVHHMPSDYSSELDRNDGPAIVMDYEDHRETASCGNSLDAREYREKQAELIKEGKFREALQMDIDDIHEKFGDKYDEAIEKMLEYVDELEQNNKI